MFVIIRSIEDPADRIRLLVRVDDCKGDLRTIVRRVSQLYGQYLRDRGVSDVPDPEDPESTDLKQALKLAVYIPVIFQYEDWTNIF